LVGRLSHILDSPAEQQELRSLLARQATLFTPERFVEETRRLVRRTLEETEN
jgi:hypothetical protein